MMTAERRGKKSFFFLFKSQMYFPAQQWLSRPFGGVEFQQWGCKQHKYRVFISLWASHTHRERVWSWVYLHSDSLITAVVSLVYGWHYNHTCIQCFSSCFGNTLITFSLRIIRQPASSPDFPSFFAVISCKRPIPPPSLPAAARLHDCHCRVFYLSDPNLSVICRLLHLRSIFSPRCLSWSC